MHLGEVFALQRALQDSDFRRAFEVFLNERISDAQTKCTAALQTYPAQIEQAIGFAAEARAAEELFNKLEAFVKDQISRQ